MNRYSAKEELILQAAEALFLTKGYTNTSTTEIAQKAGCNQALVHYYFRTKENLFQQIFIKKVMSLFAEFMKTRPDGMDFTESLRERMGMYFDFIEANKQLPFMVINELAANLERRQAFCEELRTNPIYTQLYRQFDDEVQREIQAGRICPIDTTDLYMDIISLTICTFITLPTYRVLLQFDNEAEKQYIRRRKEELITTIQKRLRT